MAQAKYYVLLFLVCLIWGATPASGKFTVDAFSPLMITGMRFALIALVLFTWLFLTRDKKSLRPPKDVLIVTFFMGVMGILVHNGLLFTGLNYTTATNTALIESIGPTATTLLAFLFLGERLNPLGWVGIAVSCVGALTIVTKGSISVLINLSFNIGDILILICEVAWSCYVVISWRIHGRLGTIGVTAWSGLFGSLLCFAVGGVTGTLHVYEVGTKALLGFAYLVIFSGIFAFVAWNFAVQQVEHSFHQAGTDAMPPEVFVEGDGERGSMPVHVPVVVHLADPDGTDNFTRSFGHQAVVVGLGAEVPDIDLQLGQLDDTARRRRSAFGQVDGFVKEVDQQVGFFRKQGTDGARLVLHL